MIKIWNEAFLKKAPDSNEPKRKMRKLTFTELLPSVILGLVTILMGLFAADIFRFTLEGAESLLNPGGYIHSVMGNQ
jgi:multicomponent Na+:H+ antiporter subunit D